MYCVVLLLYNYDPLVEGTIHFETLNDRYSGTGVVSFHLHL